MGVRVCVILYIYGGGDNNALAVVEGEHVVGHYERSARGRQMEHLGESQGVRLTLGQNHSNYEDERTAG